MICTEIDTKLVQKYNKYNPLWHIIDMKKKKSGAGQFSLLHKNHLHLLNGSVDTMGPPIYYACLIIAFNANTIHTRTRTPVYNNCNNGCPRNRGFSKNVFHIQSDSPLPLFNYQRSVFAQP